ncbi:MAG: hypothetical protein FWD34_01535 [Oscillospiraceae bacterium]|nr:hypothetical protein [Oscillospiraceae bacterium]
MKKITALLLIAVFLLTACNQSIPDNLQNTDASETVVTTTTTTTAETTATTEPESPYITIEQALQAVKDVADPNDIHRFDFRDGWAYEINSTSYYWGYWYVNNTGYRESIYVDKLTAEVFLNLNGKLTPLPFDEAMQAAFFIKRFNQMPHYTPLAAFNHINNIPLENLIRIFIRDFNIEEADFQYTEEQFEKFIKADTESDIVQAYAITPETIESFIKENYSPDFSISGYNLSNLNNHEDYWGRTGLPVNTGCRVLWDNENETIAVLLTNDASGATYYNSLIIKIEQSDNIYQAVSADYQYGYHGYFYLVGYFLHTIEKTDDGKFIIISKQLININDIEFTEEELVDIGSYRIGKEILTDGEFVTNFGSEYAYEIDEN